MAKELTGRGTLMILLASFGIVFAVNGYMAAEAIQTFRGDDEDHAYLQGIDYNLTLDRRAAQRALGWQAAIGAKRDSSGVLHIALSMTGRNGQPLKHLSLDGLLRHPTDANRDRRLHLTETRDGFYSGALAQVTPGAWNLVVEDPSSKTPFEAERSLWLR